MTPDLLKFIPWIPAAAALLCGLCCLHKSLRTFAAPICILALAGSFIIAFGVNWAGTFSRGSESAQNRAGVAADIHSSAAPARLSEDSQPRLNSPAFTYTPGLLAPALEHAHVQTLGSWLYAGSSHAPGGPFLASFGYFIDPLTILMLFVVTGIGTLVAIYAAGYMHGDRGYARFFAFVSIFIFAMTTLVMADNLVLLYLGWEGVGLCSYLLIGYYYQKPAAVAAAKKAFIVNRIGDVGFALGIFLTYQAFGSIRFVDLFPAIAHQQNASWEVQLIPFLFMLGAFGKSAQLPLYVWLPDAMEGPTPVSALIHAATMVTAGVYMVARLLPLFALSPYALPTIAVVGGLTAFFAAAIALCQYDLKRIFAYSTVSQLGYMFLGVGVASSSAAVFHLFTHAFFKALLFLTAGSVMHALSGQLDLRKISGLRTKMPITAALMLVGCLSLAGFPGTAGFFSKDAILGAVLERGLAENQPLFIVLAVLGLATAFLTAFYTFRLWFRVFMGPTHYEMGSEHHAEDDAHTSIPLSPRERDGVRAAVEPPAHAAPAAAHEVGWLMNAPLVVLAVGALVAGFLGQDWARRALANSTAVVAESQSPGHPWPGSSGPMNVHELMMLLSSIIALAGIALAAYFHWFNRPAADRVAARYQGLVRVLRNKCYVDEFYDAVFVQPLHLLGELLYLFDRVAIDGLVAAFAAIPRFLGRAAAPAQSGRLQGYSLGMALGVVTVVFIVVMAVLR